MARMLPDRPFIVLGVIAGIEGVALLAYAVFEAIEGIRIGATGPAEVSSVPALVLQIVILALFGAALVFVGSGWIRVRRWARAPFLLAQLIALVIGFPLASAVGEIERVAGISLVALAIIGIVLVFSPAVTRSFTE
ncbi:unannotated protein [freshwater metagenome]|uniref:Unannotated protein n=1 Tax=freshwater metagenome TaxID=449393 RepID=A0A6J6SM71_9ZZZZ|nr:hypothetical protein [Actinomycetota bacterium]MSY94985.1 hypothetical protein [Actinomycetota bacterium]MSZ57356.1 hypothetical protein [Actinomycetota bacterium]